MTTLSRRVPFGLVGLLVVVGCADAGLLAPDAASPAGTEPAADATAAAMTMATQTLAQIQGHVRRANDGQRSAGATACVDLMAALQALLATKPVLPPREGFSDDEYEDVFAKFQDEMAEWTAAVELLQEELSRCADAGPPGSTFRFTVFLEEDDGEWFGTFGDGESSCGSAELTDPTFRDSGEVMHVNFKLKLVTLEGEANAELSGIMNLVNGRLVLNGETTSGSLFRARVHQNGSIVDPGGDDPRSFLGELMLRPQPEPPGRVPGGPVFPPNPC